MASRTLNVQDRFPTGTSVAARKQSNWNITQLPPTSDQGSADATATVAADGTLTFTGLADDTPYYATGTVGGNFRAVSFRTPVAAQPISTSAVLQADVGPIQSQTVLQNITGLGLALGASPTEIWFVKYWLLVDATTNGMDVNVGFTVPAGCTMKWGGLPGNTSNTPGWGSVTAATTPLAMLTESATLGNGTLNNGVTGLALAAVVYGGGTAGTVQIQFAQLTSIASSMKIDRGSVMEAVRVAS